MTTPALAISTRELWVVEVLHKDDTWRMVDVRISKRKADAHSKRLKGIWNDARVVKYTPGEEGG